MKIVVIANDIAWEEFVSKKVPANIELVHLHSIDEIEQHTDAGACFDLSFEPTPERLAAHRTLYPSPVFANCISLTHQQLYSISATNGIQESRNTIRINAWPGFLKRDIIEVAETNIAFQNVFDSLNWKYETTPDIPGFITARVVSMIINEAWFALEENVSTKEEIDTAMKLGTNYPYGPFEWGEKIGLKNVYGLLTALTAISPRYQPSALMTKQILSS